METSRSTLIIVLGVPSSGKTYLANKIAPRLNIPLIRKDSIKEIMFDNLGWSDREYSKRVSQTTFKIIDYFLESQLAVGNSIMLETPMNPKFEEEKLKLWQKKYKFRTIQILCHADGPTLLKRFIDRSRSDERHPGHCDSISLEEELKANLLKGKAKTLDLKGKVIEIDTTNFDRVDYKKIQKQIEDLLSK